MTRFRVLVVDDEPLARQMVAATLREDEEIDAVFECADAKMAQELIRQERPDIVFLDIEMPERTGLDLARDLDDEGPVVVFVTAFDRYATEAFEVNASDYVLKPFSDRRFTEALHRAKRRTRERRLGALAQQLATLSSEIRPDEPAAPQAQPAYVERLSFKHNDRTIVIKTIEVNWIEAEDYYVRIHSERGTAPRAHAAGHARGAAEPARLPARPSWGHRQRPKGRRSPRRGRDDARAHRWRGNTGQPIEEERRRRAAATLRLST